MELNLFNSFTRQEEPFHPLLPPLVTMYACGPTVYNHAHIGNFRSFIYEDLLRRVLKLFGFQIQHMMNFTDVDDKTIHGAQAAKLPLREFTEKYIEGFQRDMRTLNIETPEIHARATDHVSDMVQMIEKLINRGHAYLSEDRSVYFRVNSFADYGKLARLDKEGMKVGARVVQDEYVKESYGDFALWKAWTKEDGDVAWDSPWGKGRPGWHIECSAMSQHYLGEQIDIHCGGVDLMFPHHENEIAQCECCTGKRFAKFWGHCAHLLVDGQKMSKSLGNLYTVQDVLDRGYTGRELRYVLLTTHYRQELNFTWERLDAAKVSVSRIDDWRRRFGGPSSTITDQLSETSMEFLTNFKKALASDLNISGALGYLFDFIRETNRMFDESHQLHELPLVWNQIEAILGLGDLSSLMPVHVTELLERRAAARKAKDWKSSDQLRQELDKLGWTVRDKGQEQEAVKK